MASLPVSEAAELLGVSERRVRAMLEKGLLVGERVGWSWVVDASSLPRSTRVGAGQPWSASSCWAVLRLASGDGDQLSPQDRHRAKVRSVGGLPAICQKLAGRAAVKRFYVHPAALDHLNADPQLVVGGVAAAIHHGFDVLDTRPFFEAYLLASNLEGVCHKYAMRPVGPADAPAANVVLHAVDDDVWPFSESQVVPAAVAAVDLLDSGDERLSRAAVEALNDSSSAS